MGGHTNLLSCCRVAASILQRLHTSECLSLQLMRLAGCALSGPHGCHTHPMNIKHASSCHMFPCRCDASICESLHRASLDQSRCVQQWVASPHIHAQSGSDMLEGYMVPVNHKHPTCSLRQPDRGCRCTSLWLEMQFC